MKRRLGLGALVFIGALVVLEAGGDHGSAQPRRAEDDDALRVATRSTHLPAHRVRPAIMVIRDHHICAGTDALAGIVEDRARDAATRSMAALTMGELACHVGRRGRGEGLSAAAVSALERATAPESPGLLREAAVRALGRARATAAVDTLLGLTGDENPLVALLAFQALTRITAEDHFDAALRDHLVSETITWSSTYTITPAAEAP